ncbi:uncharacterized protein LACBIDRAFT_298943 [Laccaria bicolor S238N-H82]|uniref:Predicted protein n=1 Tax=Laccaria bicolor (strain S238N-H82 / ATCC MYA-4686) TaxID=486041 RepID=B0DDN2_LACBS|nr:uncharacterized protein LACBIDRAFT_298943 [Laccaria bicolor S238N-H82]EDR07118.1 predicted protein [Laccaria bicolor S238N-H82]|eukprot:XP_001882049.1 predicted protein [Laccaria bicolor S238N-H82]
MGYIPPLASELLSILYLLKRNHSSKNPLEKRKTAANRTLALDHFSPKIRFPTLPAFIDSLAGVLLDPPMGYLHSGFATFMSRYLAELLYCPFQGNDPLKPNGELCKSYASVAELLREENRPYFKSYLKRHGQVVWDQEVEIRRAILEKIGATSFSS